MNPEISILLPIYNERVPWIMDAIESIINQTFQHWELILILDHPGYPEARQLAQHYQKKDKRIKWFQNAVNLGLARSLNAGASQATGRYLARMDADDRSVTDRLAIQFRYLEQHTEVGLCGAQVIKVDEEGHMLGRSDAPLSNTLICKMAPFVNTTTHPTIIMPKSVFDRIGGYRNLPGGEDYDLVLRLLDAGIPMVNLPDMLLYYRVRTDSETNGRSGIQKLCFQYVRQLHRQRRRFGSDFFDADFIRQHITQKLKHFERGQNLAQYHLVAARKALANGNKPAAVRHFLASCLPSPIQRRYYWDRFRAEVIKRFHAGRLEIPPKSE